MLWEAIEQEIAFVLKKGGSFLWISDVVEMKNMTILPHQNKKALSSFYCKKYFW